MQYPSLMRELGDVNGRRILDIGCGDGIFAELLAKSGAAEVVGFDKSENLIAHAKQSSLKACLGDKLHFVVSEPEDFGAGPFDVAVSNMVLPYAENEGHLKVFFETANRNLAPQGKFVSVTLNPVGEFVAGGVPNRRITRLDDGGIQIEFLDPATQKTQITAVVNQFSKVVYERAISDSGFTKVTWKDLSPTPEGVQKLGQEFWQKIAEYKAFTLLVVER